MLQRYLAVLARKLRRKDMQLSSAQELHSALTSTQGPFIEQQLLQTVMDKFIQYQQQARLLFEAVELDGEKDAEEEESEQDTKEAGDE